MTIESAEFLMSMQKDAIAFLVTVVLGVLVYLLCETLKVCKNNKEI